MAEKVQILKYPLDIEDEKYKFRQVTITIMKPKLSGAAKEAYDEAVNKIKTATKVVENASNDVKEMIGIINKNKNAKLVGDLTAKIILPLPNSFSDNQSHEWSQDTSPIGSLVNSGLSSGTKALETNGKGKLSAARNITATALKGVTPITNNMGWVASHLGTRKPLIDPGYYQNYTGSSPRTFSMSFDLIPDSAEEAEQIIKIILRLKQYSSPSKIITGVALVAPYYFNIKLSNEYISAMAKFDNCVLTNISVDYGSDGAMQQTADGFPKHINLSLQWKELHMTTREDYDSLPTPVQSGEELKGKTLAEQKASNIARNL